MLSPTCHESAAAFLMRTAQSRRRAAAGIQAQGHDKCDPPLPAGQPHLHSNGGTFANEDYLLACRAKDTSAAHGPLSSVPLALAGEWTCALPRMPARGEAQDSHHL
jgi:hypothetical protein